jgi:serine/threonine-protein kinase
MATVFLAQDLKHKRPVALKVLHPELGHALGPERFQREVELAARLQHPHILTVFDSGEAAGQLWFTMPFVEGESLRERLTRETQLPVDDAVRIAIEAARALEYAHQHGVIHRDIKPENILLTTDGSTLVADFGIARALSGETTALTETGMAVGTPAYMSPEQASGERTLDARTDIYALGCVLCEMLAGEPPFTGPTVQAIISKRMRGEVPDIRSARSTVPRAIGDAVSKALAPVPADRFATAAEFAKALSSSLTATVTSARPSVPTARITAEQQGKRRPIPAGLALLLVGFLIGVGVLFAFRRGGHAATAAGPKVVAVLPFENVGDSAQEFFADGITDAVRGKLSGLPGLQVIAGGSSRTYKHSTKPLPEIAKDLGADYLLVATVRWARDAKGAQQVMVSPELVALDGARPTTKWQDGFTAALTDVFQVQSDIAGKVAGALDLALADSASRQLAARPTDNLSAYDAFLRGEELYVSKGGIDPASVRQAIAYYQRAVSLDSNFTLAWAQLSRASSTLYGNSTPEPSLAVAAEQAARRALALDPRSASAHQALGVWYINTRSDFARAHAEYQEALRLEPANSSLLRSLALLDQTLGAWDSAIVHSRQARRLDPRSPQAAAAVGNVMYLLRRSDEAREAYDRAISLAPTTLVYRNYRFLIELQAGDLDAARRVLASTPREVDPAALVAYVATYWDLGWALDDAQQRLLLSLPPSEFDDDLGTTGSSWRRSPGSGETRGGRKPRQTLPSTATKRS